MEIENLQKFQRYLASRLIKGSDAIACCERARDRHQEAAEKFLQGLFEAYGNLVERYRKTQSGIPPGTTVGLLTGPLFEKSIRFRAPFQEDDVALGFEEHDDQRITVFVSDVVSQVWNAMLTSDVGSMAEALHAVTTRAVTLMSQVVPRAMAKDACTRCIAAKCLRQDSWRYQIRKTTKRHRVPRGTPFTGRAPRKGAQDPLVGLED